MAGNPQRTFSKHSQSTTAGSFHPGAICPPRHPAEEYETIFCLFPSFLTSPRIHRLPPAFSSEAVWMCKCYLYIVCTLMFAKRSFCSVASQPWQLESITDRKTEPFAFNVVSLKCSGVGLLGIFRGIYFGGFSGLYWEGPHFTVRL